MKKNKKSTVLILVALICIFAIVFVTVNSKSSSIAHIPLNITSSEDSLSILTKPGEDSSETESVKYIYPEIPEDFEVVEKSEESLGLYLVLENSSGEENIIFTQALAKGGYVDISVPEGGGIKVKNEKINGRNAVILEKGEYCWIIVEDGINAFTIEGTCNQDLLYDLAEGVTTADKSESI